MSFIIYIIIITSIYYLFNNKAIIYKTSKFQTLTISNKVNKQQDGQIQIIVWS